MKPTLEVVPVVLLPALLTLCGVVGAFGQIASEATAARRFVQAFYDWYVPAVTKADAAATNKSEGAEDTEMALLNKAEMKAAIAPELLSALREDREAQLKEASGFIVSIDFDPFLASQDRLGQYVVASVREDGGRYLVGVTPASWHQAEPLLFVDVERHNGALSIVNFYYLGEHPTDLVTVLRRLRDARKTGRQSRRHDVIAPPNMALHLSAAGRRGERPQVSAGR
jgi:hypothetical protein